MSFRADKPGFAAAFPDTSQDHRGFRPAPGFEDAATSQFGSGRTWQILGKGGKLATTWTTKGYGPSNASGSTNQCAR
ncbi:hypothetical protein [Paracoccus sp. IB05]|uniref:hypothetical protein n=1 Tax=Paracoccus sp. IB05 TaxID=2779367 RepID=UPI0018E82955|nr:hypothetical protein [Paracoccus sp. IB05]MBJ2151645.1 hypothetical protein [Paracoccus sp. IB05]